jgi:hypothetical protein
VQRSTCRGNVHVDDRKPAIPLCELGLQSASERTSAAVDAPPAALMTLEERAGPEGQSRSGQKIEPCRIDFVDAPSVVVYYRNEEEVRRGFLIALSAMGLAQIEEPPEPATPPVREAKP